MLFTVLPMSPQIQLCHPLAGLDTAARTGSHPARMASVTLRKTFLTIPRDRCEASVWAHVCECVAWVCICMCAVSVCPCMYVPAYVYGMQVCTRILIPLCVYFSVCDVIDQGDILHAFFQS